LALEGDRVPHGDLELEGRDDRFGVHQTDGRLELFEKIDDFFHGEDFREAGDADGEIELGLWNDINLSISITITG
jgi:hypothetical protein